MEIFLLLITIVVVLAARAIWVYAQRPRYRTHWQMRARQPKKDDSFHLLFLGDSIMQGIGASRPEKGLAGLIAAHIEAGIKRPVHIENLSLTGGKVMDVAHHQIPKARIDEADLIVVTVSANDALRKTPPAEFADHLRVIVEALPPEKTILADVPKVGMYKKYQPVFDQIVGQKPFRRASFYESSEQSGSVLGIVAGDFFHPNDKGYRIWFGAFKPFIDDFLATHKG